MNALKLTVSISAFSLASFVLTSANAFSLVIEANALKKFLGILCLLILSYIVATRNPKLKLVNLSVLLVFVLIYVSDLFFGMFTYGFDGRIVFYLVNNLVGIILLYIMTSQSLRIKHIEETKLLKILVLMVCFSLFAPLFLIEAGVISPGNRYIYFGNRYAGFSWELTAIVFTFILLGLLFLKVKINYFYKLLFILLIFSVLYLKVFSNFTILSIYFIILSLLASYQKLYFNRFFYVLSAFLSQMWEVFIVVFLSYFSLLNFLNINSGNGRVMGRVEAASHNLFKDEFSLTIYQSLVHSVEAGVDSFQHGINQFYFSFTGLVIVLLINLSFATRIYKIPKHSNRFILTFLYFSLVGHFGFNLALIIVLFIFFQIYQKNEEFDEAQV